MAGKGKQVTKEPQGFQIFGLNFHGKYVVIQFLIFAVVIAAVPVSCIYYLPEVLLQKGFNEQEAFQYSGFASVLLVVLIMIIYGVVVVKDENNFKHERQQIQFVPRMVREQMARKELEKALKKPTETEKKSPEKKADAPTKKAETTPKPQEDQAKKTQQQPAQQKKKEPETEQKKQPQANKKHPQQQQQTKQSQKGKKAKEEKKQVSSESESDNEDKKLKKQQESELNDLKQLLGTKTLSRKPLTTQESEEKQVIYRNNLNKQEIADGWISVSTGHKPSKKESFNDDDYDLSDRDESPAEKQPRKRNRVRSKKFKYI